MKINKQSLLITSLGILIVLLIGWAILRSREASERATVVIDNTQSLSVRVADTPWERARGLSGFTVETVKAQGMIFVFPKPEVQHFWMKGMKLDLDVVWIREGKIVSVTRAVPAPKPGEKPATMTSNPISVDMVLELPAGYIDRFDLVPGKLINIELP
jgi:uncharacterized membrane protein (UPF0127 family)